MKISIFQHSNIEHAGLFQSLLSRWGIDWTVTNFERNERVGRFDETDAIVVLGGAMDVWEEQEYPWLIEEKKAIASWVGEGRPLLGVCLGHQLLAQAVGCEVARMHQTGVGVFEIELTREGSADPIFRGIPKQFKSIRWHGAHIVSLSSHGECLALSNDGAIQAFRHSDSIYGLQFHAEMSSEKLNQWLAQEDYVNALVRLRGDRAVHAFRRDASHHMSQINYHASLIFRNFVELASRKT